MLSAVASNCYQWYLRRNDDLDTVTSSQAWNRFAHHALRPLSYLDYFSTFVATVWTVKHINTKPKSPSQKQSSVSDYLPACVACLNIYLLLFRSNQNNKHTVFFEQYSQLDDEERLNINKFSRGLHSFTSRGVLTQSCVCLESSYNSTKLDTPLESGFHSQRTISRAFGFGGAAQNAWEDHHGRYLFFVSFSPVHRALSYPETRFPLYFPLSIGKFADRRLKLYAETAFSLARVATSFLSIDDVQERTRKVNIFFSKFRNEKIDKLTPFKAHNKLLKMANVDSDNKWSPIATSIWIDIREEVMLRILKIKFCSSYLKCELMMTDPHSIAQIDKNHVWGTGHKGEGQNLLGKCLVNFRESLLNRRPISTPRLDACEQKYGVNFYR